MSPSFKYDKYWGIKFLIHNGKKHLVFQPDLGAKFLRIGRNYF